VSTKQLAVPLLVLLLPVVLVLYGLCLLLQLRLPSAGDTAVEPAEMQQLQQGEAHT